MDLWDNILVKPPFVNDPPVKVNVNASVFGLVIAILGGIGALFSLLGLFALFSICNGYFASACGFPVFSLLGELCSIAGLSLGIWGGWQLYKLQERGRALIIYGMALGLIGSLVYAIGYSGYFAGAGAQFFGFVIDIIIYGVVYYFLVISRFPGQPPLVAPGQAPPMQYGTPPAAPPMQYGAPPTGAPAAPAAPPAAPSPPAPPAPPAAPPTDPGTTF